jgi:hypothetical protein
MTNDATRASEKALPEITRRRMFTGAAAIPAWGLTAIVPAAALSVAIHDPIIDAVNAYYDGIAAFEAVNEEDFDLHGGEDALIEKTYGAPLDALDDWDQPALTRDGAIAALRFAVKEHGAFWHSEGTGGMVKAALAYLEREVL